MGFSLQNMEPSRLGRALSHEQRHFQFTASDTCCKRKKRRLRKQAPSPLRRESKVGLERPTWGAPKARVREPELQQRHGRVCPPAAPAGSHLPAALLWVWMEQGSSSGAVGSVPPEQGNCSCANKELMGS